MREVAVIGCGMTKFGELWGQSLRDIFVEAALQAIDDARVERIDSMYVGAMTPGLFIGQEHIGALMADHLGMGPVPAMRVESACCSGGMALRMGFFEVASGYSDIVLVGGAEKMTDLMTDGTTTTLMGAADQEWEAYYGLTFPSLYAMIARRHMFEFGTTREQMAKVAVKNHHNGSMNPIAQFTKEITVKDVLNSTIVADPLTLFDCSPITDGAAALILCKAELAKKYTDNPVYIIGRTYPELGGSHFCLVQNILGKCVPHVRFDEAHMIMSSVTKVIDSGFVRACHDLSEGGLAVAAAEMSFTGELGLELDLRNIPHGRGSWRNDIALFSESNSRFLIEVNRDDEDSFVKNLESVSYAKIGTVSHKSILSIKGLEGNIICTTELEKLYDAWHRGVGSW